MIPQLLEYLTTDDDRALFLEELDMLKRECYQQEKSTSSRVPRVPIAAALGEYSTGTLDQLRQEVSAFETIRLTVALVPSKELAKKMIGSIRTILGKTSVLLHIETVLAVGAGVILSWGGKVEDQSLRKKILAIDLDSILAKHVPHLVASL